MTSSESNFVFEPDLELVKESNIKRFTDKNAITDYAELIKRSADDIE